MDLISGINCMMFYSKYHGASFSLLKEIQESSHLMLIIIFGVVNFILFIIAIITFLNWFRRAYYNLHVFTDKRLSYDEDMAVWSFMIPFINLIRPMTIAEEIYTGTHLKAEELSQKSILKNESIISLWWILFVVLGIIIGLLGNAGGEDTIQEVIQSMLYLGIGEFLEIPRLVAVIFMIKTISKVESILFNKKSALDEEVIQLIKTSEEE
jgi:hypothetical protein